MRANTPIIEVRNITKKYNGKEVLSDVSFLVNKGQFIGLVGENGAGKSTIFKCIAGFTKPDSGEIFISGKPNTKAFEEVMADIGGFINSPGVYKNLTGYDNLYAFAILKKVDKQWMKRTIELLNMTDYINKKVKYYSYGMRQRLSIGIALLSRPKLMILDEPTNGLDPSGIVQFRQFLIKFREIFPDLSILIASHILAEIEKICDHIILISKGRIIGSNAIGDFAYDKYKFRVNSASDAAKLLMSKYRCSILDNETLTVEVKEDEAFRINEIFVKNNISVYSFAKEKLGLEDYYLNEMQGGSSLEAADQV